MVQIKGADSRFQMWLHSNWATPGYFTIMIIARNSDNSKFFPVVKRFLVRFTVPLKNSERRCFKCFLHFTLAHSDVSHMPQKQVCNQLHVTKFFASIEVFTQNVSKHSAPALHRPNRALYWLGFNHIRPHNAG